MDQFIGRLSDDVANRSSRRGFLGTVVKVALGSAAVVAGMGGLSSALASQCCGALCGYGNGGQCPPWNTEGQGYCCHNLDGYYGCAPCYYNGTTQVACSIQYSGPSGTCAFSPAP